PGPTARGRPGGAVLPLDHRAHLDRAAVPRRRDPRRELDGGVEVIRLVDQVARHGLLELGERTVGGERPAVLHPDRGRGLGPGRGTDRSLHPRTVDLLPTRTIPGPRALAHVAPAAAGAAKRAPDLTVNALGAPASLTRGATAKGSDTTANRGKAKAGKSKTVYVLSADRKRDAKDLVLARRALKPLKPRKRAAGKVTLAVPQGARLGAAFVIACADDARKVRESNERNNCRARPVTVAAPPSPGPGPQPTPTPTPIATPHATP